MIYSFYHNLETVIDVCKKETLFKFQIFGLNDLYTYSKDTEEFFHPFAKKTFFTFTFIVNICCFLFIRFMFCLTHDVRITTFNLRLTWHFSFAVLHQLLLYVCYRFIVQFSVQICLWYIKCLDRSDTKYK